MADIIDITTKRRGSPSAEPAGEMTCSFDVSSGVVTVTIASPDGDFAFGISPDGAEQMAHRLTVAALRARIQTEDGGSR